jgi:hypothetical protein
MPPSPFGHEIQVSKKIGATPVGRKNNLNT